MTRSLNPRRWLSMCLLFLLSPAYADEARVLKDQIQPAAHLRFCVTCHGVDGRGNEAVRAPRLAGMARWYLERQLLGFQAGYRGFHESDTSGQEMRPMAEALSTEDIQLVLDWIATWPAAEPTSTLAPALASTLAPTSTLTPTLTSGLTASGDHVRGQQLYQGCSACHGNQAQGIQSAGGPALAGQSGWYLAAQLQKFKSGLRGTQPGDQFGQQMRTMTRLLVDDQGINDVVSYIETL
jgi:cytochrome c oxidase subunit II